MSDLRDVLEREARRVGAGPDELPAVERRAHRRHTARRLTTGALALVLAAGGSLAAFTALRPRGGEELPPAGTPAIMTAEIAGVSIDYPSDWTLLDARQQDPDAPSPSPVLRLLNVTAESCADLPPSAVLLQVNEVPIHAIWADINEKWPVRLHRSEIGSLEPCGEVPFMAYQAWWRAEGRLFGADARIGPEASQDDVDRAFDAFASLDFEGDQGPFVESSAFPRQVVGSGAGWLVAAFQDRRDGTLCVEAAGASVPPGPGSVHCGFDLAGWESGVQPPTKVPFGEGVILFGAAERGIRSIVANGAPARIVRPLARYDVGFDLYAVSLPQDELLTMTILHADGRQTQLGEAAPAESPAPPIQTPEPISPEALSVRAIVGEFAEGRVAGTPEEELATFLSDEAFEAYSSGRTGLGFYGRQGEGLFTGWRIESSRERPGEVEVTLGMEIPLEECVEAHYETLRVRTEGGFLIVAASDDGVISAECS